MTVISHTRPTWMLPLWGRLDTLQALAVVSFDAFIFIPYGEMEQGKDAPPHFSSRPTLKRDWHVRCLFGWKLFIVFFATHSLLFAPFWGKFLFSPSTIRPEAVVCWQRRCGRMLLLPHHPLFLFHPSTLTHLFLSSVQFISTGELSCTLPPLSCIYPPLPSLPCCFPWKVNLLSVGSMNSIGLELRPTHLPDIAHVLCIAPACWSFQALFLLLLSCGSAMTTSFQKILHNTGMFLRFTYNIMVF